MNIFLYNSSPVPIRMVHVARIETEKHTSDIRQINDDDLALLGIPASNKPRYISVVRKISLNALCETPVLVSAQAAGLIQVVLHQNVAKTMHTCQLMASWMFSRNVHYTPRLPTSAMSMYTFQNIKKLENSQMSQSK